MWLSCFLICIISAHSLEYILFPQNVSLFSPRTLVGVLPSVLFVRRFAYSSLLNVFLLVNWGGLLVKHLKACKQRSRIMLFYC